MPGYPLLTHPQIAREQVALPLLPSSTYTVVLSWKRPKRSFSTLLLLHKWIACRIVYGLVLLNYHYHLYLLLGQPLFQYVLEAFLILVERHGTRFEATKLQGEPQAGLFEFQKIIPIHLGTSGNIIQGQKSPLILGKQQFGTVAHNHHGHAGLKGRCPGEFVQGRLAGQILDADGKGGSTLGE